MLCLVAIYFGAEFRYVTSQTNDTYNILTGRTIEDTEFAIKINENSILETALDRMGIDTASMKESRLAEEREEIRKSGSQDLRRIKGGSRGFLSRVFRYFASGEIIDTLIDAGVSVFHSETVAMAILILAGLLVTLFIWAFLKNVYIAILRRMFLEARSYRTVPFSHVLFFRAVDRWKKASLSMVRLSIYKLLWWFTVVGGMPAVYVLVPLIDTALSRVKTKTLSIIGMVLVVTFAADMVYSHYVPNTGEGITDYDAYKKTGAYYTESDA